MPLRPTPQIVRIYFLVAALLLSLPGFCSLYSRYEGRVLVALGRVDRDPYFARTVVYIGQHDGWRTMGLILNRPLSKEHFDMLKNAPPGFDWRFGGPIDYMNAWFVLIRDKAAPETLDDKRAYKMMALQDYIAAYPEEWAAIQDNPEKKKTFAIFAGYSGWGPVQLESEIRRGGWGVTDFTGDMLIREGEPFELWRRAVTQVLEKSPLKDEKI